MSSPEYSELRGVSGTAVAPRAAILDDPAIRRLLWFLQARSLEQGGLKKVAREILEQNPHRIGTPSMHKFGMKPGKIYNAEQVKVIRVEGGCSDFPLRGEVWDGGYGRGKRGFRKAHVVDDGDEDFKEAQRHPISYPAEKFIEACRHDPETLATFLTDLCVNPLLAFQKPHAPGEELSSYEQKIDGEFPDQFLRVKVAELNWFQDIIGALLEYQRREEAAARADFVLTAIGRKVWETLDFALKARRMVVVEGWEGRGKSEAVKVWCRIHRGDARFVDLAGVTSKTMVFRAIAKALGIASSYSRTATEMQARIEDVLQRSKLMLVFDEAHFLFNQSPRIYARPELVDWIDTALCNHDVPVALITTPQFINCVKRAEVQVGWNWRQFRRRVRRWVQLPEWNTDNDLEAVAQKIMPGISRAGIKLAIGYAKISMQGAPSRDISGLGDVATEARLLAEQAGRTTIIFEDVERAINEYLLPSDTGFAARMIQPLKGSRKRALRILESPLQARSEAAATPLPCGSQGAAAKESENFLVRHREILPRATRQLMTA
jgi:hypothetical protein